MLLALSLIVLAALGCAGSKRVILLVDGERRVVETRGSNVGEVLREQGIVLGDQDRVEPPDYTPVDRTATIRIVRVAVRAETVRVPVEFERTYTREENLPEGQVKVSRLGENGEAEIVYQVTLEDGREVSRRELTRQVVKPPVDELLLVGTRGVVANVPVAGALAYLGKGNAWIVRGSTDERRPLTTSADLDGRVFDLSPDGKYLLFTRAAGGDAGGLNTLWVIDTVPFNAEARRVPLDNVLYAQWAPDGSARVAYSGGERTPGAPGWKAYNDLTLAALYGVTETLQVQDTDIQTRTVTIYPTPRPSDTARPRPRPTLTNTPDPNATSDSNATAVPTERPPRTYTPRPPAPPFTRTIYITTTRTSSLSQTGRGPITVTRQVVAPRSAPVPYSWWGWNLAWAPDARRMAYAFPDQVGVFTTGGGERLPLAQFASYNTRGDWVWVPQLAWSPDGKFLAATVHAPPNGAERAEDAPGFDLFLLASEDKLAVPLARNTGMWAFPAWSPAGPDGESKLAFGVTQNQANSERSLYSLYIMDRDGSNRERIFPERDNELGGVRVVQLTWSPDARQLVALRDGDLWLYDLPSRQWAPLTANGDSRLARWK